MTATATSYKRPATCRRSGRPVVPADDCATTQDDYGECLDPSLATTNTLTRGVAYSASIAQGRHTIALSGNTYASLDDFATDRRLAV